MAQNVCLIAELQSVTTPIIQRHYIGFPQEIAKSKLARQQFPIPHYLVIQENADGILLYRYTDKKVPVGDTWHANVDDAKHQARFEYGEAITEWNPLPNEFSDVFQYIDALNGIP